MEDHEEPGEVNLSGAWAGAYSYPTHEPPVLFDAVLRDGGGVIDGTTIERDALHGSTGRILSARLDGHRRHRRVTFWKTYETASPDYGVVLYDGQVSQDGLEIAGRWTIPSIWSGTFLMIRADVPEGGKEHEAEIGSSAGSSQPSRP